MTIIQDLAKNCASNVGHLKGKKRDEMTLIYWAGAWAALDIAKDANADWVGRVTMLLIASRGYSEVERLIEEAAKEAA